MKKLLRISCMLLIASTLLSFTSCLSLLDRIIPQKTPDMTVPKDAHYGEAVENPGMILSKDRFSSEEAAAERFIAEQINGEATDATLISCEKTRELSAEEIAALPLGNIDSDTVISAALATLTYSEKRSGTITLAASQNEKTCEAYILEMEDGFAYLPLTPQVGDVLTAAYFETLYTRENLLNYTKYLTMNSIIPVDGEEYECLLYAQEFYTEDAIYTENTIKIVGDPFLLQSNDYTMELKNTRTGETTVKLYEQDDGEKWSDQSAFYEVDDFSTLNEYMLYIGAGAIDVESGLDHSYYFRTENGFSLNEEKAIVWIEKLLEEELSSVTFEVHAMKYDAVVINDRVAELHYLYDLSASRSGETIQLYIDSTMSFFNYGNTTTPAMPDDLCDMISESGYTIN